MSAALAAACLAPTGEPAVRTRIVDALAGVRRLRFATIWTGAANDVPHGAGLCDDGSLIRAYRDVAGEIRYQRGTPSGSFTARSGLASGSAIAVSALGNHAVIAVEDGTAIRVMTSADNGATWSIGWATAASRSASTGVVGTAQRPNGDRAVFFADGTTLKAARQTAGSWGAVSACPAAFGALTGLAASHDGADWCLIVTSDTPAVWTLRWGDGGLAAGTWETPRRLVSAEAGIGYRSPQLMVLDTYRATFVEQAAGTTLNLATWMPIGATWVQNRWREPSPLPTRLTNGVALCGSLSGSAYRTSADRVDAVAMPSLAGSDLSGRLLRAEWTEAGLGGRCRLVFDNTDGTLSIPIGSQIAIASGYRTAGGAEVAGAPEAVYWADRVTLAEAGGRRGVTVEGGDIGWLLDRWQARRPVTWPAGSATLAAILGQIAAFAGVAYLPTGASSELTSSAPAVSLPENASALAAIRRLLQLVRDRPFAAAETLDTVVPDPADSSVYTFGTSHPIRAYARVIVPADPAFVRVQGTTAVGISQNDDALALLGDGGDSIADRGATSAALAQAAADGRLRDGEIASTADSLTAAPCPAIQPNDVVTVTAAGIVAANRRVRSVRTVFDRSDRVRYEQTLLLGVP